MAEYPLISNSFLIQLSEGEDFVIPVSIPSTVEKTNKAKLEFASKVHEYVHCYGFSAYVYTGNTWMTANIAEVIDHDVIGVIPNVSYEHMFRRKMVEQLDPPPPLSSPEDEPQDDGEKIKKKEKDEIMKLINEIMFISTVSNMMSNNISVEKKNEKKEETPSETENDEK